MARRVPGSDPAYCRHKSTNRAFVSLPQGDGTYQIVYLGVYDSEDSRREYDRVIAEWKAGVLRRAQAQSGISVAELLDAFLTHAETYYRKDEARTSEYSNFVAALRPVFHLYSDLPASEFSPNKLRSVRQLMIGGYKHPRYGKQAKLSRNVINSRVRRIVHVFKWGVGREMIPATIHQALQAVEPLEKGRSEARETNKVTAVPRELIEATLPHLPAPVAALVRLGLLTGARPGELVQMSVGDIERNTPDGLWNYKPARHKTQHHDQARVIVLGPRAQELLAPWIAKAEADGLPLFSPAREAEERYARLRAVRKTPVQPSQKGRRKAKPKRRPRASYDTNSYAGAIRKACKAHKLAAWHPHQLRHNHAEEVRKRFGLDHVQAALGHATRAMSERYADLDLSFASDVAKTIG